jgi:hypothetical protein
VSESFPSPPRHDLFSQIEQLRVKIMQLVLWLPVGASPPMSEQERIGIAVSALCAALAETGTEAGLSLPYVQEALKAVWNRTHAAG